MFQVCRTSVPTDPASAISVIRGVPQPEKNWKIKEMNGS
jgi:hypothetical protein